MYGAYENHDDTGYTSSIFVLVFSKIVFDTGRSVVVSLALLG